ncbi:MAG: glycosyl transferase [Verrucomicrobia bacterium]|nr:glycosyl transferase [Verrucomicrobiota bacterium]
MIEYQPIPAATPARSFARKLRLGSLLYAAWHRPRASLARSVRAGGPWQQWLDARGQRAMEQAARHLPPLAAPAAGAPEVHFLTGRRFWYQSAFCFHSLRRQAGELTAAWIDDGTIDPALAGEITRLFPGTRVRLAAAIEQDLDRHLPSSRFPTLRRQRLTYLHLRKLTDVHAGSAISRLVLDSDMLFFRAPDALLGWLHSPDRPVHMLDHHNAYGYPLPALARLAGRPLPDRINVGVCGFPAGGIDWERMEAWATTLLSEFGSSYYLEQALVAMNLAGVPALALPADTYRLMPDVVECRHPTAILHHYVDLSKRGYFRHAWRHFVGSASPRSEAG